MTINVPGFGETVLRDTDAMGNSIHFKYDSLGHKLQKKYGSQGSLSEAVDAMGHKTNYAYNRNGFATSLSSTTTNTSGNTVVNTQTATLDANDRITQLTGPIGRALLLQYDPAGNTKQITNRTFHRSKPFLFRTSPP